MYRISMDALDGSGCRSHPSLNVAIGVLVYVAVRLAQALRRDA